MLLVGADGLIMGFVKGSKVPVFKKKKKDNDLLTCFGKFYYACKANRLIIDMSGYIFFRIPVKFRVKIISLRYF